MVTPSAPQSPQPLAAAVPAASVPPWPPPLPQMGSLLPLLQAVAAPVPAPAVPPLVTSNITKEGKDEKELGTFKPIMGVQESENYYTSEEEIDLLDSGPTDPHLRYDLFPPDHR